MRVLHVITGIQKAAGTSVFCCEVANGLVAAGHEVTIAVGNPNCKDHYPLDPHIKLISIDSLFRSTTHRPPLRLQPGKLTTNHYDLVHLHALWSPILHKVSNWARKDKIPVIWSTHGMTAPWSMRHKWWKKLPAWWLYQRWDLAKAALLHATAGSEVEDIRRMGLKNKVVVAPLGVNVPKKDKNSTLQLQLTTRTNANTDSRRALLFVGRIYPVKGLVNLIRAWSLVQDSTRSTCSTRPQIQWKLRIVGPDQAGHLSCLKAEVQSLGLEGRVEFPGPKFGEELSQEYENCDCLVLPSFTENFGVTIVDALAHGKPCIASTFTPWKELKDRCCGWWVSNEPELLAAAIHEMMSLSDAERHKMGARGRALVEEKYTWDAVVKKMVEGYGGVLRVV